MRRFLAWDIVLPWAGCLGTWIAVQFSGPARDGLEVLVALFLPIGVCLVRAWVGIGSLRPTGAAGMSPLARTFYQVLFAISLALLMVFEMFSTALCLADDEPLAAWGAPLVLYAAYCGFMLAVSRMHARVTS